MQIFVDRLKQQRVARRRHRAVFQKCRPFDQLGQADVINKRQLTIVAELIDHEVSSNCPEVETVWSSCVGSCARLWPKGPREDLLYKVGKHPRGATKSETV